MRRKSEITWWVDPNTGCHVQTAYSTKGKAYAQRVENGKRLQLHRIVYEANKGAIPEGLIVRHTCDNKMCINPEHLILGTHADNMRDMAERGGAARGERNGFAKLTESQVREILKSSDSHAEMARRYGVCRGTIHAICTGRTWNKIKVSGAA